MESTLEFERPIALLEKRIQDLQAQSETQGGSDFLGEIAILEKKCAQLLKETYDHLTPWQRVHVARHANRPYTRDYIDALFPDFMELHGDRTFGDDQAIIAGLATWNGKPLLLMGHQKGRSTKQKMERNFGMAKPEGYRKAIRLLKLAERSHIPVLTLIDTPGAFPGIEAEERGQSCAIAESIQAFFSARTPIVSIVIGEGGSGGALALGVADQVFMLEHSIYSVISPESCASILWSDASLAEKAAERIKMSANDLLKFGVIDEILPEPLGGAHRNWPEMFERTKATLDRVLNPLLKTYSDAALETLVSGRCEKFRRMGNWAVHLGAGASAEVSAKEHSAAGDKLSTDPSKGTAPKKKLGAKKTKAKLK